MITIRHAKEKGHNSKEDLRFRCPECEADRKEQQPFCSPCHCPEQIPQPRFSSPNSSFPPEDLEELTRCIEEANELLLSLALERDLEEQFRFLQASLRQLRNVCVCVLVDCGEKTEEIIGLLNDAGKNFLILETEVGNTLLIPFERLLSMKQSEERHSNLKEQELLEINPCLRRNLTFDFGATVSKSPLLLNLFFGIELSQFLDSFLGYHVYVRTEKNETEGRLLETNDRRIDVKVDGEKQGKDFDEICMIEIEQEALRRSFMFPF